MGSWLLAVLVFTCRLVKLLKMAKFSIVCVVLLAALASGQRAGKNLRGTFPFNSRNNQNHAAHHGDHHGAHHGDHAHHEQHAADDTRASRQRGGGGNDVALDIGSIAAAGERCIDKVVMVEETEYDDVVTCKHSYSENCHTLYESACTTRYQEHDVQDDVVECETIQEEKCEDVTQGYTTEQKCTKWPVQKCKTSAGKVKKYSPETECKKVPREACGPGTTQVPGQEECFDRKETVNLEPQRICKHVTKLVPLLKPTEECVDIPKE